MAVGRDQAHSTLEVALPSDPGKQVAPEHGKQHINDSDLEPIPKEDFDGQDIHIRDIPVQRLSARRRIIFYGIVGSILILGAVLGGVLGSRHKSSGTVSSTNPSNSSAAPPSVTPIQRNIAAVSFISNSANNTRLYFQDDAGQIIEASNSESNLTWSINKIGVDGKNGSVIAAAVSRPSLPLEISIFYLDVNNLLHDITYTGSTGRWTSGTLSAQGYTAMPNSSLSAMYNWCILCANTTLIAFQDENGFVQIGNLTLDGWTLKQWGQGLKPVLGTGLALHPFYRHDSIDQINLYYQNSNLNMVLSIWNTGSENQRANGWSLNEQIYDPIPSGSPIAAASSYSNVSTGFASWIEVLHLSSTGVEVNTWSGAINDWLEYNTHPSVMANSTNKMKVYETVAVTATGNGFAVVKKDGQADAIENWKVADDTVDWSLIGNVNLHGALG